MGVVASIQTVVMKLMEGKTEVVLVVNVEENGDLELTVDVGMVGRFVSIEIEEEIATVAKYVEVSK